jgi:hypothetical protein
MPAWMTSLLRELTPAPIPLSLSTTITSRPVRASARATARPMTPAPTTRHSTDSIRQLSAPSGAFFAANILAGPGAPSQKTWRRSLDGRHASPAQSDTRPQAASCGILLASVPKGVRTEARKPTTSASSIAAASWSADGTTNYWRRAALTAPSPRPSSPMTRIACGASSGRVERELKTS